MTRAAEDSIPAIATDIPAPFAAFARSAQPQTLLRSRITAAYRRSEEECVRPLLTDAALLPTQADTVRELARTLVEAIRGKGGRGGVEALVQEYALSSQEGVALMCLAEALLRIPDASTRNELIRDKIGAGDWRSHVGHSPSPFVNAATWGLVLTGKLTATSSEHGLGNALTRLIARGGETLIHSGVHLAMRMMGDKFVTGETIQQALANGRKMEAKGFRYSYDMLGEAAMTARDAERYRAEYEGAIHAIGQASGGRGLTEGPGISVKLSALHPRYSRLQRERVMTELLPNLRTLTLLARRYDIGLNIDAEETERLDLSLDLLEALCGDPELAGWNGIGFVVQAYQKRAPFVLDFIIDLARRSGRRIMVRLVKGAYWDSEIKRAQVDGQVNFPVFTRKPHTDISYLACARKLLDVPDAVFPQFATHNAQTVAAIYAMAGADFHPGQYEFQCLHGMGEALYDEVVGPQRLDRPCRIYAPVGTHETLLAYLVRRLLENGANSSFIHRIADPSVSVEDLIEDPVAQVRRTVPSGGANPAITAPRNLFPDRRNSHGLDLSDEQTLASLAASLLASTGEIWRAEPPTSDPSSTDATPVLNPADHRDVVGHVVPASAAQIEAALARAASGAAFWGMTDAGDRATCLERTADLLEARMPHLLGLIIREAAKSIPNAVGEMREAIDFLRYYAAEARRHAGEAHRPLGPVLCISPWNFPLAIFVGQIAAALAAGNPVLAKPAEETPLIAAQAVHCLHQAGIPPDAIQLLPGDGAVGAMLVADPLVQAVLFTGSTDVGRLIQDELAKRLNMAGSPVPLIAETGGQNALIVDSSALTEQVVMDTVMSAFDSAGQRCSALRVLCLQDDIADRTLAMLKGAVEQLEVGNPDMPSVDVGPVISEAARARIALHVARMRNAGHTCYQSSLPASCDHGTFVSPTIIEISDLSDLRHEVFGPVLHVLRYKREDLEGLIGRINATGYALTFGVHSRIDETIAAARARSEAGNVYVNRNLVGAVVGVQPFGGHGLSGTGPKAGGPLTLRRLVSACPVATGLSTGTAPEAASAWIDWLREHSHAEAADRGEGYIRRTLLGSETALAGAVGEANCYGFRARGAILCHCEGEAARLDAISAALATGNRALLPSDSPATGWLGQLPPALSRWIGRTGADANEFSAVLWDGPPSRLIALQGTLAAMEGPIIPIYPMRLDGRTGEKTFPAEWLLHERSVSVNTAAAGGNAALMAIG